MENNNIAIRTQEIAYLRIAPRYRKYNDVLLKKLMAAGIATTVVYTKHGKRVLVSQIDQDRASRIRLSISLTNPQY